MPRALSKPTGVDLHFSRYVRVKSGLAVEDIAKRDGVSVETVQESIRWVEQYRARNTVDHANEATVAAILENKQNISSALTNGLTATYETQDKDGKKVSVPDVSLQLQALDRVSDLLGTVQPKPARGGINVGVGVGVGMGIRTKPGSSIQYMGFEDRLREVRRKRAEAAALPSPPVDVSASARNIIDLDDDEAEEGAEDGQPSAE